MSKHKNKRWLKPNETENRATTFSNDPQKERDPLIGAQGETATHLHPTGQIQVGGRHYDAVAEGTFISAGERVRITGARDFRLIVEKL